MIDTVRPTEIATLLGGAGAGIKVLSLDCFDTLLWRIGHGPRDVFAELDLAGGAIERRMAAESAVRGRRRQASGHGEVTLAEIYAELMPGRGEEARVAAIAHELEVEARHCYPFAPVVDLLRSARARGLRTIVVSDTYLSRDQLRALIAQSAGEEVGALIDEVFVSCQYGRPKAGGLFEPVLERLGVAPYQVLHLGDNREADHIAPVRLGIRGVHLQQFDARTEQQLRMEAAAAALVDPAVRRDKPAYQPHRPGLALRPFDGDAERLGYDVIGPILTIFAQWVTDENASIARALDRPVRSLFLLRAAHLPARISEAAGHGRAQLASVSRFTARQASFADPAVLLRYLASERHERLEVHAEQLMLSPAERKRAGDSFASFQAYVRRPEVMARIVARGDAAADRLVRHLRDCGIGRGDAVMLIDLGYNGSVQNAIAPILERKLGLKLFGRYLLLREIEISDHDKRGLFDVRNYDDRALAALTRSIAVIEQLSTNGAGSVVGYRQDGRPLLRDARTDPRQCAVRERVQDGACRYAKDAGRSACTAVAASADAGRHAAMGSLARLLFMPSSAEVGLLESFAHDVNLGTSDRNALLSTGAATQDLRRRGLKYAGGTSRLFPAGELNLHSLELGLAHFAQTRFALELRDVDAQRTALQVPVVLAGRESQTLAELAAYATTDGFFRLLVPIGLGELTAGILVGRVAQHVELLDARVVPLERLSRADWNGHDGTSGCAVTFDGVVALTERLLSCNATSLLVLAPTAPMSELSAIEFVFRPIGEPAAAALRLVA